MSLIWEFGDPWRRHFRLRLGKFRRRLRESSVEMREKGLWLVVHHWRWEHLKPWGRLEREMIPTTGRGCFVDRDPALAAGDWQRDVHLAILLLQPQLD